MVFRLLVLITAFLLINCKGQDDMIHDLSHSKVVITVVYDNVIYDSTLTADWGFGCVIRTEKDTVLFDTGSNGKVLLANMQKLAIDPATIQSVVISHNHWDHQGGLMEFLAVNARVNVFIPNASSSDLEQEIKSAGAQAIRVDSFRPIGKAIYLSGELKENVPEQSLVVRSGNGLVLITGCAHPGIVHIIEQVRALFALDSIYLVMGGFHLKNESSQSLISIVDRIQQGGVQRIAPSHCTGEPAIAIFQQRFGDDFIRSGVGRRFVL